MHGLAVELVDRSLGFLFGAHGDKGKPAGCAGELVLHQQDFGDGAGLREQVLQIDFKGFEGEISDKQFGGHNYVILFRGKAAICPCAATRRSDFFQVKNRLAGKSVPETRALTPTEDPATDWSILLSLIRRQ